MSRTIKRLGFAGLVFFTLKGIAWLAIFGIGAMGLIGMGTP